MGWWNSWKDTAQRLVVPFGIGADREKSPWWDLGGQMTADGPGAAEEKQRKAQLQRQASEAGLFADESQQGVRALGGEASAERQALRDLAAGKNSVVTEQLRQANQQLIAGQNSIAAGAAPRDQAMSARTAAIQSGRIGSGMAGQAATAQLQEQQNARSALRDMIMQQREQDLRAALGSRQTAVQGYGGNAPPAPEKSWMEKYGPAAMGAAGMIFSDERLKEDIEDGDKDADRALAGLRAVRFKYKDQRHGAGPRVGILAQDLERAGLKHAVIETPEGKAIHGGHLAASNTAMLARLGARISKLEKGSKGE